MNNSSYEIGSYKWERHFGDLEDKYEKLLKDTLNSSKFKDLEDWFVKKAINESVANYFNNEIDAFKNSNIYIISVQEKFTRDTPQFKYSLRTNRLLFTKLYRTLTQTTFDEQVDDFSDLVKKYLVFLRAMYELGAFLKNKKLPKFNYLIRPLGRVVVEEAELNSMAFSRDNQIQDRQDLERLERDINENLRNYSNMAGWFRHHYRTPNSIRRSSKKGKKSPKKSKKTTKGSRRTKRSKKKLKRKKTSMKKRRLVRTSGLHPAMLSIKLREMLFSTPELLKFSESKAEGELLSFRQKLTSKLNKLDDQSQAYVLNGLEQGSNKIKRFIKNTKNKKEAEKEIMKFVDELLRSHNNSQSFLSKISSYENNIARRVKSYL